MMKDNLLSPSFSRSYGLKLHNHCVWLKREESRIWKNLLNFGQSISSRKCCGLAAEHLSLTFLWHNRWKASTKGAIDVNRDERPTTSKRPPPRTYFWRSHHRWWLRKAAEKQPGPSKKEKICSSDRSVRILGPQLLALRRWTWDIYAILLPTKGFGALRTLQPEFTHASKCALVAQ